MPESLFFQIGGVIVIAAALSFLVRVFKQPLVIAYLVAGILVGPAFLALTHETEVLDSLGKLGVAFLLFTVGLGLNWRRIREVGTVAVASGLGQVFFTSAVGFLIAHALGFDITTSLFISIAFSFSSTIIIVKMLMDKEDLDTLYGKIAVGFLIVQDLVAMIILLVLGAVGKGQTPIDILWLSLAKGLVVVVVFWFLSAKVVPHLVKFAASSQELLLVFSLGWCFTVAGLLYYFGFGVEIGALIAGVALSGTHYEREINARIKPLRDFFLILFFIVLGSQLQLSTASTLLWPIIIFSLYVLIGNPIIMMLVLRALGYHPQTGFLTGTTAAQVSEFSFIMLGAGISLGFVSPAALTLATVVGLITIAGSTYLVKENERIYEWLRPVLRFLENGRVRHAARARTLNSPNTILFGCHRTGEVLLNEVKKIGHKYLVVDYDPNVIEELKAKRIPAIYGDAGDEDFLKELRAEKTRLILSTIPDVTTSLELLTYLREEKFKGTAIVAARSAEEALECYTAGAAYVIVPSILGAERFSELLRRNKDKAKQWEKIKKTGKKEADEDIGLDTD
ncbi:MAG: cation:proton antiporter [Patescibacteria group bacterium]|jgi:Kef-type K+ transport system membrane component KefB